jgi:PEGA domain
MYVGDTPTGRESLTISVKSGPHTVKITKIGYDDYTQNVYFSVGQREIVTATLSEKSFPYYTLNPTSAFTEPYYST